MTNPESKAAALLGGKFLRISFKGLANQLIPVEFADDASRIFSAIRDANGFGASDMKNGCGDLLENGRIIGRISYNGRVWQND